MSELHFSAGMVAAAVCAVAAGQIWYKYYFREHRKVFLVLSVLSFILATISNFIALKALSVDTVYTAGAATMALVVLYSVQVFREKVSGREWAGIACIITGIIIYNLRVF